MSYSRTHACRFAKVWTLLPRTSLNSWILLCFVDFLGWKKLMHPLQGTSWNMALYAYFNAQFLFICCICWRKTQIFLLPHGRNRWATSFMLLFLASRNYTVIDEGTSQQSFKQVCPFFKWSFWKEMQNTSGAPGWCSCRSSVIGRGLPQPSVSDYSL